MAKLNEPVTPEEFEQQAARIVDILKDDGAKVTWDDKIPDPDNPAQLRQIDVTIKRDNLLTIVECRLHNRPQDVKWIEELYGRHVSLKADSVIAVSSSGFTSGAIAKARRLGVVLRDLRALADREIASWGRGVKVTLQYIQFGHSIIYVVRDIATIAGIITRDMFRTSTGEPVMLGDMFKVFSRKLHESGAERGEHFVQLFPEDLYLSGAPVKEILLRCKWKLVRKQVVMPVVYIYAEPSADSSEGASYVEKTLESATEIYHVEGGIVPVIDTSSIKPLDRGFFQSILMDLGDPPSPLKAVEFIGEVPERLVVVPARLQILQKHSAIYNAILAQGGPILSLPS
jgi:hypothetical protein